MSMIDTALNAGTLGVTAIGTSVAAINVELIRRANQARRLEADLDCMTRGNFDEFMSGAESAEDFLAWINEQSSGRKTFGELLGVLHRAGAGCSKPKYWRMTLTDHRYGVTRRVMLRASGAIQCSYYSKSAGRYIGIPATLDHPGAFDGAYVALGIWEHRPRPAQPAAAWHRPWFAH